MKTSDSEDEFKPENNPRKKYQRKGSENYVIADIKKKRGRPKGSKNKTHLRGVIHPDQQEPVVVSPLDPKHKIILKINVSKGTVKGLGMRATSTGTPCGESMLGSSKLSESDNIPNQLSDLPKCLLDSDSSLTSSGDLSMKCRAKTRILKSLIVNQPEDPAPALPNYAQDASLPMEDHAIKADRLKKRYKSVRKRRKQKKSKSSYFTLKPEMLEDNSARSSGSSSSDEYYAWKREITNAVVKQMDLPDSSPEKGKRQPSPSPPTSPEGITYSKSSTNKKTAVQNLWPSINADQLKWVPARQPDASLPREVKFKSQVQEFFSGYLASAVRSSGEPPGKPNPVRFPVVHEANCCMQWRQRSAARGKQPAGHGTRKRKGVRRGYLTCPCQNGAGPSSVAGNPPRAINPLTATSSKIFSSSDSKLDDELFKMAKNTKVKPWNTRILMDISDDSDGEPLEVRAPQKSPLPEEKTLPAPCTKRRLSSSSNSSDVQFVPGPPIEEIVVSDDSNDIIFVSETASPVKATSATSTPKKEAYSGFSTESADIIFDFSSNPVSPHASFLRRKLPVSPVVDSPSNDNLKTELERTAQSNPVCVLPPAENFVTAFDSTLESLYPAYPKLLGRTPEPLDFDALLDFEAESMTAQNYGEPYSPCMPDPPIDEYDRGEEIINIESPERGVPIPEPVPEKTDGLVVWECPVCFEPKGEETILATTDCTHLFCDPCIRKVASMYGKCPVCQCPIKESSIHPFRFHGYKF